jgi:hypothetical protein
MTPTFPLNLFDNENQNENKNERTQCHNSNEEDSLDEEQLGESFLHDMDEVELNKRDLLPGTVTVQRRVGRDKVDLEIKESLKRYICDNSWVALKTLIKIRRLVVGLLRR